MLRCPVCGNEFPPNDGPNMPFCSERCRMIDLGRWLDERYGLPIEPEEGERTESQPS
ncbi:MAG: DNA gyrase inhibitor YacG [Pirellulales bacterium]|nr:DNA gyrase inhibitor YacG [Pirellulales bacterium]